MKTTLLMVSVLAVAFVGFSSFHSKSIDRALLVHSKSALLEAQRQLHEHGSVTNKSRNTTLEVRRERLTVSGINFGSELAAQVPGFADFGSLLLTTNGVFIWMDRKSAPMILGGGGYPSAMPHCFRDF